jgi:phage terminase Nu1 subunit (DNA packaging protein)
MGDSLPKSIRLSEMALLLNLTERRVQQLADQGIVTRESHGRYHLAESVQGYIAHWRNQALQKEQRHGNFSLEGLDQMVTALDEEEAVELAGNG